MRSSQFELVDSLIDPIPVFGPLLADLFYTWASFADAMNLQRLSEAVPTLPPTENVVRLPVSAAAAQVQKAA